MKDVSLAESLALHLVRVAEDALRRAEVGHVFAEGGATAVALARRMGWKRLAVTAELAPGVVTLSVSDGDSRLLTIKPGSYAWPETLREAGPPSDWKTAGPVIESHCLGRPPKGLGSLPEKSPKIDSKSVFRHPSAGELRPKMPGPTRAKWRMGAPW